MDKLQFQEQCSNKYSILTKANCYQFSKRNYMFINEHTECVRIHITESISDRF